MPLPAQPWIRILAVSLLLSPLGGCADRSSEVASEASALPLAPTNEIEHQAVPDASLAANSPAANSPAANSPAANSPSAPTNPSDAATLTEPPDLLTADELAEGWFSLFDGKTLFGWEAQTDANWRVEAGTIVVDQGENGLLCSTTQFADYVLKLEFRSAAGANSGVFLHTPPRDMVPAENCYELNIADADNPFPTGSLVNRIKAEGDFESEDWQAYEVTVEEGQVTVKLDGKQVLQYTDPQPLRRGYIGLQVNTGKVEFRDIKLRPLRLASAFNGKDLTGWKEYPEMASRFTVTEEGCLNVKNGRGQLETDASYGDFVFQMECITHAPALNSGIFFRCIPGETMNGYESQIHNACKEGDRTVPVDHGTGGIFRRQPARLVIADDETWFYNTIIADGPHMAVWVNGCQVSDWTDDRAPDENPRKGLRVKPGTIMIQGHDPTTNISFRNIRVSEMPPRSK